MESLLKQYSKLSYEEKQALFIYKSGMGELLNDLDNELLLQKKYNDYLDKFSDNFIIRYTYFSLVDMTSIESFKESLIYVKQIIDEVSTKLVTNQNLKLFRLITSNKEITDISKGNIISTTTSPAEVFKYELEGLDSNIHKLDELNIAIYEIDLPAGSHVCCVPGRFKYKSELNFIDDSSGVNEEEIILNKDIYDIDVIKSHDNDGVKYIKCMAIDKYGRTRK